MTATVTTSFTSAMPLLRERASEVALMMPTNNLNNLSK